MIFICFPKLSINSETHNKNKSLSKMATLDKICCFEILISPV